MSVKRTSLRTRIKFASLVLRDRGVAFNLRIGNGTIATNKPGKWNAHNITHPKPLYDLHKSGRDAYVWELGRDSKESDINPFKNLKYTDKNPFPGRYSGDTLYIDGKPVR